MSPEHVMTAYRASALLGCALFGGCASPAADSTAAPAVIPGQISVTPSAIDMGDLALGENLSVNLEVSNIGEGTLTLYDVQVLDDRLRVNWSLAGTTTTTLAAGGATTLVVSFSPHNLDAPSTALKVLSDDPSSPIVTVPLTAASHGIPALRLDVQTVDLGQIAVGSRGTADVRIANDGTADLVIASATLDATDKAWSLAVDPTGVPVPAQSELGAAVIDFQPTAAGVSNASLILVTNDPDQPTTTIQLVGTGI
jgi:hypothetical protein